MESRFLIALAVFGVLGLTAAFTLTGLLRTAVWIVLGGLAVKTLIAKAARW